MSIAVAVTGNASSIGVRVNERTYHAWPRGRSPGCCGIGSPSATTPTKISTRAAPAGLARVPATDTGVDRRLPRPVTAYEAIDRRLQSAGARDAAIDFSFAWSLASEAPANVSTCRPGSEPFASIARTYASTGGF